VVSSRVTRLAIHRSLYWLCCYFYNDPTYLFIPHLEGLYRLGHRSQDPIGLENPNYSNYNLNFPNKLSTFLTDYIFQKLTVPQHLFSLGPTWLITSCARVSEEVLLIFLLLSSFLPFSLCVGGPCQNLTSTHAPLVWGTVSIVPQICIPDPHMHLPSFTAHPILINLSHFLSILQLHPFCLQTLTFTAHLVTYNHASLEEVLHLSIGHADGCSKGLLW
jgi:hypothetical protein